MKLDTNMLSKNKRIVDKKAMLKVKCWAKGKCEYCNSYVPFIDPHHIKTRGSGGHDIEENLIGVCRKCHQKAEGVIKPAQFLAIAIKDNRPKRIREKYKGWTIEKLKQEIRCIYEQ